jgi:predicted MFS family arabinose efflux permease
MSRSDPTTVKPVREPRAGGQRVARAAALLLAAVVVSCVAVLLPAPQPVRALGGIALIGFLPGAAVASRLLPSDRLLSAVVAVALSLAMTVAASLGLLYLRQWSWQRCVLILAVVAVAAVMLDPHRWRLPWRRSVL